VNQFTERCGAEDYYPFNPSMSLCCGVSKFRAYLDEAESFIRNNWGALESCDYGMKEDEKGWAAYYLASASYHGDIRPTISEFVAQRDDNGNSPCSGVQNYIEYFNNPYSKMVVSRYIAAIGTCDSECPT